MYFILQFIVDRFWHENHIDNDFKVEGVNRKFIYLKNQNDSEQKIPISSVDSKHWRMTILKQTFKYKN